MFGQRFAKLLFLWYSMSISKTMKVLTKEIDMNNTFNTTLHTQAKREFAGLMFVMFAVMTVSGFLSNVVLNFTAVKDAGYGFFDYMMTSDLGFVVLSWNYNSLWLVISLIVLVGSFIGVVALFNKR